MAFRGLQVRHGRADRAVTARLGMLRGHCPFVGIANSRRLGYGSALNNGKIFVSGAGSTGNRPNYCVYMISARKRKFLEHQYRQMLTSGHPVDPRWRESFDAFEEYMDPFTPNSGSRRRLGRRNSRVGFVPGNVEWHWESRDMSPQDKDF